MKFDRVLGSPPWNQKWAKEELKDKDQYDQFKYGIPPKYSADWGWVQHMLARLKDSGKMGIILDNGALLRSRKDREIRRKVLNADLVEAVILLPEKLFHYTNLAATILIINADKLPERKNKVLFMDAQNNFKKGKRQQNFMGKEDIEKIVNAIRDFEDIEEFCRGVSLEEIESNDHILQVSRYINTKNNTKKVMLFSFSILVLISLLFIIDVNPIII